jgi:PAS domain S-box-containing protein
MPIRFIDSIRFRAAALVLIPILFIVAVSALAAAFYNESENAAKWSAHSDTVLDQSRLLALTISDANKNLAEYTRNHSLRALSGYTKDATRVKAQGQQLVAAVSDNPAQQARASRLSVAAWQIMSVLSQYLSDVRAKRTAQGSALINAAHTRKTVEEFQSAQLAFDTAERALGNKRLAAQRGYSTSLIRVIVIGSAAGILVTLVGGLFFGLRIARRLDALGRNAERFQFGQSTSIPIEGYDEIARLDRIYQSMAVQISEREQQLQKYKMLAEQASDIIFFSRRETGEIFEANTAALRAYGCSREEFLTKKGRDLRAPEYAADYDESFRRAAESGIRIETVHRRCDNTTFPVEVSAQGALVNGEHIVISIIRDISERRRQEQEVAKALSQAVEASRLKSQFVATMSHEIRTPMNGVIGTAELLQQTPLNSEQQELTNVIRESGKSLLRIIDDILDFSKIEADALELEFIDVQIVPLVEGVTSVLASQAAAKGISLMTFIDPEISSHLYGDPGRLRQILLNLAGNAVKFTDNGGVVVSAELLCGTTHGARIGFSVRDTGIGISPAAAASLFQPFQQADGSTTRKYGGTGLGLSISKRLIELMGGAITVESRLDEGSTFRFEVELKHAPVKQPNSPRKSGMHVLVVDDDPVARDVIGRYLRSWKMRFDTAQDAADALRKLEDGESHDPYDVAIIDLVMPGGNGIDLAKRIRERFPSSVKRMVLVTAHDRTDQGSKAIAAGFAGYLVKPIRQSQLYDCIVCAEQHSESPNPHVRTVAASREEAGTVLVVEDNPVNRTLALRQLAKLGYSAEAVSNGREAIEAIGSSRYYAVLMDCHMPEIDGFEATRTIRKMESRTGNHVFIIAMTANALAEDREACLAAGMDDYLSKPVTLDTLRAALEKRASQAGGAANGAPILNWEQLLTLFEDEPEGIESFIDMALRSMGDILDRLRNAQNQQERRSLAHEFKGTAASTGAVRLSNVAAQLERGTATIEDLAASYREVVMESHHVPAKAKAGS